MAKRAGKRGQRLKSRREKKKLIRLLIITLAAILVIALFSRTPTLSEWYIQNVYPFISTALSSVSGLIPFSVYDLFIDRKSTRLNSSHVKNSYAVFCLKKKK